MNTERTPNRRLATSIVVALLSLAVLIFGSVTLAGAAEYENTPNNGGTSNAVAVQEAAGDAPTSTSTTVAEPVPAPAPEPVAVNAAPASEAVDTDTPEPVDHDCDAFFAELDAAHNADSERFAEVLESFNIAHEVIAEDGYIYVETDYADPIVESISNSYWMQVSEGEDPDLYEHPCFQDDEYAEGCLEGDYELTDEEMAEMREQLTAENQAVEKAFTEAGITFAWETDDYFEIDVITWDYEDEAAMNVWFDVFYELNPDIERIDYEDGDTTDLDEEFEASLAERNATIEDLAVAFAEAGVTHELTNDYGWMTLTFDLDDDQAKPIVAARR